MRYIYSILFYLILPFVLLRLLWRSRHSTEYRKRWGERFGFCPHRLDRCIWVHAASVGETLAAIPLIKALKKQYPEIPILITNMTINGSARTQAAFGDTVFKAYVPYDVPCAVKQFLNRCKPVLFITIETELWPNILAICKERHIPVFVANARLSEKSAASYKRIARVTRAMLSAVTMMAVQTQVEAERFIALGLSSSRVQVTGSIKFDIEVSADIIQKGLFLREMLGAQRPVWMAASTHQSEEDIVLEVHQRLLQKIPSALLILVPRHPERFNAVFTLVEQKGLQVLRRSQNIACTPCTHVYLGDTMGELLVLYGACDITFIGGSFVPVGGHNMLEAAVLAKPIITGPQLFNFSEISHLLIQEKAMLKVDDVDALTQAMLQLLQNKNDQAAMGQQAIKVVTANRGSLTKQLACIQAILDMPDLNFL